MPAFTFYILLNLLYSPATDVLVFVIYIRKIAISLPSSRNPAIACIVSPSTTATIRRLTPSTIARAIAHRSLSGRSPIREWVPSIIPWLAICSRTKLIHSISHMGRVVSGLTTPAHGRAVGGRCTSQHPQPIRMNTSGATGRPRFGRRCRTSIRLGVGERPGIG